MMCRLSQNTRPDSNCRKNMRPDRKREQIEMLPYAIIGLNYSYYSVPCSALAGLESLETVGRNRSGSQMAGAWWNAAAGVDTWSGRKAQTQNIDCVKPRGMRAL